MAGMSHRIRERTDALDAAGNTTAAIGKVKLLSMHLSSQIVYSRVASI
jgi:Na+/H+-translocating membrane pyrophosphatase